jgi:hypothetical protein
VTGSAWLATVVRIAELSCASTRTRAVVLAHTQAGTPPAANEGSATACVWCARASERGNNSATSCRQGILRLLHSIQAVPAQPARRSNHTKSHHIDITACRAGAARPSGAPAACTRQPSPRTTREAAAEDKDQIQIQIMHHVSAYSNGAGGECTAVRVRARACVVNVLQLCLSRRTSGVPGPNASSVRPVSALSSSRWTVPGGLF